jgi:hypothetical protein
MQFFDAGDQDCPLIWFDKTVKTPEPVDHSKVILLWAKAVFSHQSEGNNTQHREQQNHAK